MRMWFLQQLILTLILFSCFLDVGISDANSHRENEIKCHQLLRTSDYERHKDRNLDRVKGTCQWFLTHSHYKEWRDSQKSNHLFVSADPGCGKSVLSKFLADKKLKARERIICYFFFKDENEDQKTATNALCVLLHQPFTHESELRRYAVLIYEANESKFLKNISLL